VGFTRGGLDGAITSSDSLNPDPYNLCAEELAMADCTQGVAVRRTWSEKEMVRTFGGQISPGTPDGMFESWDGTLTCVQVVRAPLTAELSLEGLQETLRQTILTKVVKSQHWLRAVNVAPQDFIIFCWLPFPVPLAVVDDSEALMQRVQDLDARFSLRLRVPPEVGSLFPALFACNHSLEAQRLRSLSWEDVTTYTGGNDSGSEEDCDDFCAWNLDLDWAAVLAEADDERTDEALEEDSPKEDPDWEWDIAWVGEGEGEHLVEDDHEAATGPPPPLGGVGDAWGRLQRELWDDNG
jgi:hypothetical protein